MAQYSRYTDFEDGIFPDLPGDLIPNGGVFDALNFLFDRRGKARKRGGTYSTTDKTVGFRYLAALQPGTIVLTPKIMGVNGYVESSNYVVTLAQPNQQHQQFHKAAHDNETYINFMVSSATSGNEVGGTTGGGGASWDEDTGSASDSRVSVDSDEATHAAADEPVRIFNYQFFTPWPTNQYGYMFAIGDAASVGVETTNNNLPWPDFSGTSATASTVGSGTNNNPDAGDLVLCFLMVRGGKKATTPTDTSGNAYTLVYENESTGGVTAYLWQRTATAGEPNLAITSVLDGSAYWHIHGVILGSPSSDNIYLMDEGSFVQTHPSDYIATFTTGDHDVTGAYGADILYYPDTNGDTGTLVGRPVNFDGFLLCPVKSRTKEANYLVAYGGTDLTVTHFDAYEPTGDKSVVVTLGSQLVTTTSTDFVTESNVGDMVIIRNSTTAPTYTYVGRITKINSATSIYVEPTPTVTGTYTNDGALKTAPAVLMPDHYSTSKMSSDIACAWQYRMIFANPSPWFVAAGLTGPVDLTRTIMWTTQPTETVSAHTGLYLDGLVQASRESVMPNNFLSVPEMAGPIVAMAGLFSTQLVLFGEHEIWAVMGNFVTNDEASTGDNLQVLNQSKAVGCINKDSLQSTPKGLVFASSDGVYVYNGNTITNLMAHQSRLANTFRDSLEAGATVLGSGLIRGNHYVLSMSDVTYMMNMDNGAWTTIDVDIYDAINDPADPSKCFGLLYGNISGDPDDWDEFLGGQVVQIDTMFSPTADNINDADETPVLGYVNTRTYVEGEPMSKKMYKLVTVEYYLEGDGVFTLSSDTSLEPSRATYAAIGTLPQNAELTITGATNATPIVITAALHGLTTNDAVVISGVLGNTAANGKWNVTRLTAHTFSLNASDGNSAYTSGGTVKHDDTKTFLVTSKVKIGHGIAHKLALTSATAQAEVLGVSHGYNILGSAR